MENAYEQNNEEVSAFLNDEEKQAILDKQWEENLR
jgi:hypothetical protein